MMRHNYQWRVQQAKTRILAMRYFRGWRDKCLVNDPACGIILYDAGIEAEVFDSNISALEAGIGAFPRRLMIDEARLLVARTILADAGELYDD